MKEFFKNIRLEWDKITWPTPKEAKQGIIQVFVFMIALSLFFAGVDALVSTGMAFANREPAPVVDEVDDADYEDESDETFYDIDLDELDGMMPEVDVEDTEE